MVYKRENPEEQEVKSRHLELKFTKYVKIMVVLFVIAAALLSGCVENRQNDTDAGGPTTGGNGTAAGNGAEDGSEDEMSAGEEAGDDTPEEYTYGTASAENIEVVVLESFPVQIYVAVEGTFPDGCTEIYKIIPVREGHTFNVTISTKRPKDAFCTEALVQFSKNVPLNVYGLEAGTYYIYVNGIAGSFELAVDNVIPPGQPKFTEADNGTTANLENGTTFFLELPENPSTGYSWELELSPGLSLLSEEYVTGEPPERLEQPIVGAGGLRLWGIKAIAEGGQQLKGVYKRPWEEETGFEKNFTINIKVVI